ncbi:hypothetical protein BRM3_04575 [Brachybacterium huguangmaarense]|uniref:Uncharacterized protein n=1 Tax=Brachybacterium huguangmaarense TaxID=1652028 RepID=A0ABY6G501_9MICO|nr:hypothetical protein [Brachybacterium huguangmaarense]UYG17701.1 hypothetical protein BRM3_04575 [Brachybacterium huguangmaarense]
MTTSTSTDHAGDIQVTERDMLGALELLAAASPDPDELLVLTDEELLGLAGPAALELLGGPYLAQDRIDAESSSAAAVRSLAARRLVTVSPEGREDEGEVVVGDGDPRERAVQLDRRLAGAITLRRIPEAMMTVSRTLAGGTTVLGLYLFPGGGVLEEYVTIDGFHHLSLPTLDALPERLAVFVDPFESAHEDGAIETVTPEGPIEDYRVEGTRSLAVLTSITEGAGRQATFFGTEDRLRVLDNGTIEGDDAERSRQITDVSATTLRAILEDLVPVLVDDETES